MTFTVSSFQTWDMPSTTRSGTAFRVVGFLCTGSATAATDSIVLATYINSGSVSSVLQAQASVNLLGATTSTVALVCNYGSGSVVPGTINASTYPVTTISGYAALV